MDLMLGLDLTLDQLLGLLLTLLLPSLLLLLLGQVFDLEQLNLVPVLTLLIAHMVFGWLTLSVGHAHERHHQALDYYSHHLDLDRSKQFDHTWIEHPILFCLSSYCSRLRAFLPLCLTRGDS
jgi:hypothetical protein